MNTTNEYPPRHIPGFRPLILGEQWHRTDFTPDMLPEGWRPLMLGEKTEAIDELPLNASRTGDWRTLNTSYGPALERDVHFRTCRPLPPPPPTFEYYGNTWNSHVPGDPCPVEGDKQVVMLLFSGVFTAPYRADCQDWSDSGHDQIIGYLIPDAEPQDETAKLRERIAELEQDKKQLVQDWADDHTHLQKLCFASGYTEPQVYGDTHSTPAIQDLADMLKARIAELEQQIAEAKTHLQEVDLPDEDIVTQAKRIRDALDFTTGIARGQARQIDEANHAMRSLQEQLATALTPRPIAEAGPVKEGFVRLTGRCEHGIVGFSERRFEADTHYLDIRLPSDSLRAEYDRAVAEAGGAFEAWLQAKGGVK